MGLIRLLRTTAFRSFIVYFALFTLTAAASVAYIYWKTNVLLTLQLEDAIQAEIQSLDEQYGSGGIEQLVRTIADELDVPCVDPRERFLDGGDPRALSADDGIHLSEAGYRLFYGALIEQVRAII